MKSIALAAGAGIAVGLCATVSTRRAPKRELNSPADDLLRIEPLLDRLERIEIRLESGETHGSRAGEPEPVSPDLIRRVEEQGAEIEVLRVKIGEAERRAVAAVEAVETRFRQVRQEIPSLVESNVAARLGEVESRTETQVETKVSERIGSLERTLAEQSVSIGALRDRAQDTDVNLQRLIAAIERLCERTPQAPATVLPFEAHMAEAAQREPSAEPRVRVIKEKDNEPETGRTRFPLARIFAFILALGLPRLVR